MKNRNISINLDDYQEFPIYDLFSLLKQTTKVVLEIYAIGINGNVTHPIVFALKQQKQILCYKILNNHDEWYNALEIWV